jgi:transposase InsO family protein
MSWTEATPTAFATAMGVARGAYQKNILQGYESLSGSTLRGKAARWIGRYRQSSEMLLYRVRAAGVVVDERKGKHGKRILVLRMSWEPAWDDQLVKLAHEALEYNESRVRSLRPGAPPIARRPVYERDG